MIKIAILGVGKISYRFAETLKNIKDVELYAVGARSEEKANLFKKEHDFKVYYNKFEDLINDPNIDMVYIALPHDLHYKWSRYALSKGVAVLCEKPATLNSEEMYKIADFSKLNGVLFMEAMKPRFTPVYKHMKYLIENEYIGEIKSINLSHCFSANMEDLTYHLKDKVGGVILDVSCYSFSLISDLVDGDVTDVVCDKTYTENDVEVDITSSFKIKNTVITFENSFLRDSENRAIITGTEGEITIYDLHRPTKMDVKRDNESFSVEIPYVYDDFYGEVVHFINLVKEKKVESDIMSLDDSIEISILGDTFRDIRREK